MDPGFRRDTFGRGRSVRMGDDVGFSEIGYSGKVTRRMDVWHSDYS